MSDPAEETEKRAGCVTKGAETQKEKDHPQRAEKEDGKEAQIMRIVVVTGASSGMGREFVRQIPHFYSQLDEIWVTARREERLRKLQEEVDIPVRILVGDLTSPIFLQTFREELKRECPDIRMLVNSAGFGKSGLISDLEQNSPGAQAGMVPLNCQALTEMTLLCEPYFSKGSRILQLASSAAFFPQAGFAVYAATKSYVLSFSRALHAEWKQRGIWVTAVCPGPVDTEFFEVSGPLGSPLKKLVLADPSKVVRQALLDSRKRKPVSVYGICMKLARLFGRLIPTEWILTIEMAGKR